MLDLVLNSAQSLSDCRRSLYATHVMLVAVKSITVCTIGWPLPWRNFCGSAAGRLRTEHVSLHACSMRMYVTSVGPRTRPGHSPHKGVDGRRCSRIQQGHPDLALCAAVGCNIRRLATSAAPGKLT